MRVLAVTPWNGHGTPSGHACGIANYAAMLQEGLRTVAPDIELVPDATALDPVQFLITTRVLPEVLWLNYHRGLHSRWTPEVLRDLRKMNPRVPVVVTFHDTYGEREPDELTRTLYNCADAFVVHEPCVGLPEATLIRQGVPDWTGELYVCKADGRPLNGGRRPVLGTCGFNFPWKNFDRLAEVTAEAGWGYLVVSNNATDADEARWLASNPHCAVVRGYQRTADITAYLVACDATAFPYECANSGTSGAIRLGLAARKPVLAFRGCRQFRDLWEEKGAWGVRWADNWGEFEYLLRSAPIQRVDPGVVYLAERDSWARQALKYADLFWGLVAPQEAPKS